MEAPGKTETHEYLFLPYEHQHALHCPAPACTLVYCTARHCTPTNHAQLHRIVREGCTAQPRTALHCTALRCTALHSTRQRTAPHRTRQRTALHRTALHCTARDNKLHCTAHQPNRSKGKFYLIGALQRRDRTIPESMPPSGPRNGNCPSLYPFLCLSLERQIPGGQ